MSEIDIDALRLDGVYRQRQPGLLMVRVKVPGSLTSGEAEALADIADQFSSGILHLTTRGCIELHGVTEESVTRLLEAFRNAALTSRGACGGAVRGIACGLPSAESFPRLREVAARLHARFTGDPRWEIFPKKFKIGVFSGCDDLRYLIQDFALVDAGDGRFHLFCAGGLGREPREAFALAAAATEEEATALVEKVATVYAANTPKGKRLKHLVREIGEAEFFRKVGIEPPPASPEPGPSRLAANYVEAAPFAGELPTAEFRAIAGIALRHGGGLLFPTADQNIALIPPAPKALDAALAELAAGGLAVASPDGPAFRICPGNHECRLGLAATRDIARELIPFLSAGERLFAISGCPNSCSQPQLAGLGLVAVKGGDQPLFDLYRRRENAGFSTLVRSRLSLPEIAGASIPD